MFVTEAAVSVSNVT